MAESEPEKLRELMATMVARLNEQKATYPIDEQKQPLLPKGSLSVAFQRRLCRALKLELDSSSCEGDVASPIAGCILVAVVG